MKKTMTIATLLIAASSAHAQLQSTPLYPLKVGSRWTYVVADGKEAVKGEAKKTVTIEVERPEPFIRKTKGAGNKEVEIKNTGFILKMTSGANVTRDHVVVLEDGLYKVYVGAAKAEFVPPPITPPLCAIKLGGTGTWEVDCKSGNTSVKGSYSVRPASVKVPAFDKAKQAFLVSFTNNAVGDERVEIDCWYVVDVGMVRQRVLQKGREIILDLEKYEPAK